MRPAARHRIEPRAKPAPPARRVAAAVPPALPYGSSEAPLGSSPAAPRPGLAEAVDRLYSAGTDRIYLATITGTQRGFTVFLSEDLTRCIACMG